jgi:hypothetical protein
MAYEDKSIIRDILTPIMPNYSGRLITGADADALIDNELFALDATAVTPSLDYIGNRPVIVLTNSGSTATDGAQFQVTAAHIRPRASKEIVVKCSYRGTTASQDFAFGLAAIDTSAIASDPTDFIRLQKLAAASAFSVGARKASGTAETWTTSPTVEADTWYDMMIRVVRDSSTAGKGIVQVWMKEGAELGVNMNDYVQTLEIATQLPDTVDLAPYFAFRAGSAANVSAYVSHFGWAYEL